MTVHRIAFEIDGKEAPAGYRAELPRDMFDQPLIEVEGVAVRVASPLTLYQLRAALASQGTFGEPSERQQQSARQLRERFFPDRSDSELEPRIERLP